VVFFSSIRTPNKIMPKIAEQYDRTLPLVRSLPSDVLLGLTARGAAQSD
jgi:hypothetical protein